MQLADLSLLLLFESLMGFRIAFPNGTTLHNGNNSISCWNQFLDRETPTCGLTQHVFLFNPDRVPIPTPRPRHGECSPHCHRPAGFIAGSFFFISLGISRCQDFSCSPSLTSNIFSRKSPHCVSFPSYPDFVMPSSLNAQ
ncbi:hypothetical protein V8E51_011250 [Hyaloscypha variabilis]